MGASVVHERAIPGWPVEDRPRERLWREGERALTNAELLAVILRTGSRGLTALDLARALLREFGTLREMSAWDPHRWRGFPGLGSVKIAQLRAAFELGRRAAAEEARPRGVRIRRAADLVAVVRPRLRDLKKEVFSVVFLDARHRLTEVWEASVGTVDHARPILREIFQEALARLAVALIFVHNHPSGEVDPSPEDLRFTEELVRAGRVLGIRVLDHIIIGGDRYCSLAETGRMSAG